MIVTLNGLNTCELFMLNVFFSDVILLIQLLKAGLCKTTDGM